ncbi:MAG TPA: bifunctional glutamate N-acetyltransferase/amino-acid acetyltransferase ArgJ, partial [Iamia sp.]|nr:bifunctional glutamate N-acetyltransferase/amino-acid acetyltransferase ArgJ [Iamia sp.]
MSDRTGVTAPQGFVAGGVACGVKESGDPDLAVVATADGRAVPAAGVFTANLMTAAPVQVSQANLAATGGRAAAVILNSGNANAATGAPGREHSRLMGADLAAELGCAEDEVLVCSTGLIGIPLPIAAIRAGIPDVVAALSGELDGGAAAAEALRTTDTRRKEAVATAGPAGTVTVGGMAKGAAMLAPSMATMLAVLTTDAEVPPEVLQRVLAAGVAGSFNSLLTDGCTSTNDTVLLLASGEAGPVDEASLASAVTAVCTSLAEQMADDAEGATKVVRLTVAGAVSDAEARIGAERIARSLLCKCSWYGRDPYWGRLASELGSAGIGFDQELVSVAYGGVVVASEGVTVAHDAEAVAAHMDERYLAITCDLGLGPGTATVLTNDLTHAYVDENM